MSLSEKPLSYPHPIHSDPYETQDALFNGRIKLIQKRRGYRFSMDAVILAQSVSLKKEDRVVDLGTGCGIIPLILCFATRCKSFVGVEIQHELAELARRNAALNGQERYIQVLEMDVRRVREQFQAESFTVVVSNPPFRIPGTGRINPNPQKAAARHGTSASLGEVLDASAFLLGCGGRAFFIYPASLLGRMIFEMKKRNLEPKCLKMVHTYPGSEAKLAVLQAHKGGGEELIVSPPLIVYEKRGIYTPEMEKIYSL